MRPPSMNQSLHQTDTGQAVGRVDGLLERTSPVAGDLLLSISDIDGRGFGGSGRDSEHKQYRQPGSAQESARDPAGARTPLPDLHTRRPIVGFVTHRESSHITTCDRPSKN